MLEKIISFVMVLMSCWVCYLFLKLDPATPFYVKVPETWYLLIPIAIVITVSSLIFFYYFIKLRAPYRYKIMNIVVQICFVFMLVYAINYDVRNSIIQLRIYNSLLFCFFIYYTFKMINEYK